MNTRRIPIALFILLGVCAALAYAVGSIRPLAPGAKFSNLPPPVTTTQPAAAMVPPTATIGAVEVVPQSPSSTPIHTAQEVSESARTSTPIRAAQGVSQQTPFNTPTRILTRAAGITRIAQATVPPTETPAPDAESVAATETAAPAKQTLSSIATQTSVLAQETLSAIATRAFGKPALKKPDPARAINKTTNFLLIGTDSRTDDPTWVPNTDVMMVLFLDTANQRAALLSLPRDLVVAIPGQEAFRINSAYHHGWFKEGVEGGVSVLKQILRDDFEIRIDHWALIDFDGLSEIIDTLGGIEVNVPCALSDTIDLQPFTIPAGKVEMDYLTAKRYVQSRYTTSDTSRNHRQQRVVWAMAKKALDMNAPDRVPLLYEKLSENVATDMNLFNMIGLVPAVYQLDLQNHPERLRARVLEAPAVYPWISTSGAWLYMPNYDEIRKELDEIFQSPQVALTEATPAECPIVPSTPQPTDVPTITPEGSAPAEGVTVTPDAQATPNAQATPEAAPNETAVGEIKPTDGQTVEAVVGETPAAEATPQETPTPENAPASVETPPDLPTETPTS